MAERKEQIERLRKRHRLSPDSKVFAPLADLLRQEGQLEEALILLEDGLVRHPRYLTAMVILGRTLLDAERRDHALSVLGKVLELDPENFVALGLVAEEACCHHHWDQARPLLEKLVLIEPHDPRWPRLLTEVRAEELVAPASETGQEDAAEEETGDLATMTMVDIYINQGYYAKAIAALRLIHARDPDRTDVKPRLVEVLALLDMHGEGNPPRPAEDDAARVARREGAPPPLSPRRDQEKKHFAEWINRIQSGEGNPS